MRCPTSRRLHTLLLACSLLLVFGKLDCPLVDAFAPRAVDGCSLARCISPSPSCSKQSPCHNIIQRSHLLVRPDDDNDDDWMTSLFGDKLQQVNKQAIGRDAILASSFVLGRFVLYDIAARASTILDPMQEVVWLTGTFSSAVVLVTYWTIAGLLSRSYEKEMASSFAPQVLINVVLCCPIWLATERWSGFGPADISGPSFGASLATGFLSLATFMILGRGLISLTEDDGEEP